MSIRIAVQSGFVNEGNTVLCRGTGTFQLNLRGESSIIEMISCIDAKRRPLPGTADWRAGVQSPLLRHSPVGCGDISEPLRWGTMHFCCGIFWEGRASRGRLGLAAFHILDAVCRRWVCPGRDTLAKANIGPKAQFAKAAAGRIRRAFTVPFQASWQK